MKKIIIITLALIGGLDTYAQQDAMYTHYMFNTLAINPAYAGSRDALTVTTLHRSQWVGFEGAPTTQTLTLHSPILNDQLGLGFSVLNDNVGPINTTAFYADFAYKIRLNEKAKLSFGLKGGINLMQGELNTLKLDKSNDNAFAKNVESNLLPNFGFGIYYYTSRWYLGLSTPKLLENNFGNNTSTGSNNIASEQRHYFLIAGSVFNLNSRKSLKFKPTTFVKVTNGAPIEADLTGVFIIQDQVEIGGMYRTGDAAGILLGYNFTNQLRFGYSFDWSFTNTTGKYNSGSHEVMLRYDFIYKGKFKIRSPRYF